MIVHEVSVLADVPGVLMLTCSCGWREELPDSELPLLEVTRRAAEHEASARLQEDMLEHWVRGHVLRVQRSEAGFMQVCSCSAAWPLVPAVVA